jgi:hypothetical protein
MELSVEIFCLDNHALGGAKRALKMNKKESKRTSYLQYFMHWNEFREQILVQESSDKCSLVSVNIC